MKKIAALIVVYSCCLLVTGIVHAQNLVPNPSFEEYSSCPDEYTTVEYAFGWVTISNTPNYFNRCATSQDYHIPENAWGNQNDDKGNGYCGFWAYYYPSSPDGREFFGCELNSALEVGSIYYVSFFVSLSDNSNCGVNNIGTLFSTVPFNDTFSVTNFSHVHTEQVATEQESWLRISGEFVADSSYRYLVIGNLYSDNNTDTILIAPPTIFGYESYYFIDNICVSIDSTECDEPDIVSAIKKSSAIIIYPNPTYGITNLITNSLEPLDIKIYDLYSTLVLKRDNCNEKSLDLTGLPSGIYVLEIVSKDFYSRQKLILTN